MKSALTLLVMVIVFTSCGRNNNTCRSQESMRIECRAVNQPTYGYGYAQRMCDETYSADRCY